MSEYYAGLDGGMLRKKKRTVRKTGGVLRKKTRATRKKGGLYGYIKVDENGKKFRVQKTQKLANLLKKRGATDTDIDEILAADLHDNNIKNAKAIYSYYDVPTLKQKERVYKTGDKKGQMRPIPKSKPRQKITPSTARLPQGAYIKWRSEFIRGFKSVNNDLSPSKEEIAKNWKVHKSGIPNWKPKSQRMKGEGYDGGYLYY